MYCTCLYDGIVASGTWLITSGGAYAEINENGRVNIKPGASSSTIVVECDYKGMRAVKTITVTYDNYLIIESPLTIAGTTGNAIARYNGEVVAPTWSITSGGSHASVDASGQIAIQSSGDIVLQASYARMTATKNIALVYEENTSSHTTVNDDGSVTTET